MSAGGDDGRRTISEALPRAGEVLHVGVAASVQFAGDRALTFRVIRVDPRMTYDGWLWIDGYVLGPTGEATERRVIFVKRDGLRRIR
ncbi:hypothetical protein QLQ12_11300 [Actinoplanes sp. NEAU-A12]|uniref:Uncharacterized protein n=1 Tax=Actinoplanes sandaracinus TaxID=3045177 RepID=A0ABT6WHJ3_9ACTN|nr:hypothetical protein [Actinoplanes sandaracinus]MDI6099184.1 hypothetical protein [Actinoplanes sandaracinus]